MIQIERDSGLRMFELTDENNEESEILTGGEWMEMGKEPQHYCKIIAMKAKDSDGTVINRFIITDRLLKDLAIRRGWM